MRPSDAPPDAVPIATIAFARMARWARQRLPIRHRVYVASPEGLANHAKCIAEALAEAGFEVCSRWHEVIGTEPRTSDPIILRERLRQNFVDLAGSDLMVIWTASGEPRTTYVEAGWAQVLGVPALWVQGLSGARTLADQGPGVEVLLDTRIAAIVLAARALLHGEPT